MYNGWTAYDCKLCEGWTANPSQICASCRRKLTQMIFDGKCALCIPLMELQEINQPAYELAEIEDLMRWQDEWRQTYEDLRAGL